MRRQAKASSAGSIEGSGKGRGHFRRAFLTRGVPSRSSRSDAPSSRRSTLAFLGAVVLAITVSLGAAAAVADTPPVVTIDGSPTADYTTAQVSGAVNPSGGPSTTYWHFEFTTTPDDESSWQFGPSGEIAGPEAEGTSPVPVSGKIESLQPETEYSVRLVAENEESANRVVTGAPYPTFTTKGPVAKPTVSFDPITVFTGTTAKLTGTINPNAPTDDPGFNVHYEFICEPSCALFGGLFNPGGDIAADNTSHPLEVDLSNLEPNTDYDVELIARNAGGEETAVRSFHTDAVAPAVETVAAFALKGGTEASLGARVNPKNTPTTYWIEYGTSTAYGSSVPVSSDASAGSGGKAQIFSQKISGLAPSTEYHFRALAESAEGKVEGKDMNFETAPAGPPASESCGNGDLRRQNNSTNLPDCRAYEQVSPVDKNGYDAPFAIDGTGLGGRPSQDTVPEIGEPDYYAAEEGSELAFESAGGFGDARSSSLFNHYLSRRTSEGWTTEGLDPARPPSPNIAETPLFRDFGRENLRYSMFATSSKGHIAPGDSADANDVYLRDNATGTYYTLSLEESIGAPGSNPQTPPRVFEMRRGLLPGLEENFNNNYVYEWDDGHIELASVGPDGSPFPEGGFLLGWGEANGTRRVIVKENNGPGQLFMRTVDATGTHTVGISASRRTTPDPAGPGFTELWEVSPDGSKVLFSTTEALTDDAPLGGVSALYLYDAATDELTNITASAIGSQELVGGSGLSPDSSYVYFRSLGRFHPGENDGKEAGFFVWHNGTVTQFGVPQGDRSRAEVENRPEYTANGVSPNGRFFTFTTRLQMTAYDNTDKSAKTESGDPKRDAEVYVYDAVKDRLTCVSCNPTGAPPVGDSATSSRPFGKIPRQTFLLNDGRTFFNSSDVLVPEDVNGQQDVYEWVDGHPRLISPGVGPFATYGSASADGRDVYIATRAQLIPSDHDELADIYDARVEGGFAQPTIPSICESVEGCHGPASGASPFSDPGSEGFSSGLKPKSPAAQRLRRALKACKHRKTKKARARCRAAAKKRFGKASNGRAH